MTTIQGDSIILEERLLPEFQKALTNLEKGKSFVENLKDISPKDMERILYDYLPSYYSVELHYSSEDNSRYNLTILKKRSKK